MKVIELGILPEERVYQARCTSCKSLIEFDAKEAKYVFDPRDGDCYKISCPVCNRDIYRSMKS